MSTVRIAVLSAGLSQPSSTRLLADRLTEAVVGALEARARSAGEPVEVAVDIVEVRDIAHDLVNNVLSGFASPALQERLNAVVAADAVIVATPIYAASYSGLLKLLVDVLPPDALRDMPVLLGATGGTSRHSLALDHALRPLFAHLGALVAPVAVFAASKDWGSVEEQGLGRRIDRAGAQLAGLVSTGPGRQQADPFGAVTPFESLLAQASRG